MIKFPDVYEFFTIEDFLQISWGEICSWIDSDPGTREFWNAFYSDLKKSTADLLASYERDNPPLSFGKIATEILKSCKSKSESIEMLALLIADIENINEKIAIDFFYYIKTLVHLHQDNDTIRTFYLDCKDSLKEHSRVLVKHN